MPERVGAQFQICRNAATFSRNSCRTCNPTLRFPLPIASGKNPYPQQISAATQAQRRVPYPA
jgi:hypothetical protein